MPKFTRTKENLEFLDELRRALEDQNARSYGLYVRLFKEFGRMKMAHAMELASDKPREYRLRYFLGVLMKEREQRNLKRRATKMPRVEKGDSNALRYAKLRAQLLKKMTPPYERTSRTRSRLYVKIAREERKSRRSPTKQEGKKYGRAT